MPPKSPDEPVFYDPDRNLWAAVQDGIIDSTDVTRSGRLRADMSIELPAPSPSNWAANIQASSPFGMQTHPNFGNSGFVVALPSVSKTPPPVKRSQTTPPPAPVRLLHSRRLESSQTPKMSKLAFSRWSLRRRRKRTGCPVACCLAS